MSPRLHHTPQPQRGAATLAITVLLSLVMLLVVGFANRNLLLELRSTTNQYRATQAFEAAEAGLDWAQAQLNNPAALTAQCQPSTTPESHKDAHTLRGRLLNPQTDGRWAPHGHAVWCAKVEAGWSCQCPSPTGPAATPEPTALKAPLAFSVRITAGERPDLLNVAAHGCAGGSNPCLPGEDSPAEAQAQLHMSLGALPLLASAPSAPLSVRGDAVLDGPWHVERLDPSGSGLAVHLGGALRADALRVAGPPGSPLSSTVLSTDAALASVSAQALFLSLFRLDPLAWQAQPLVQRIACESACDAALAAALRAPGPHPALWLPHGLRLHTTAALGSPAHPVLLVVDGPVQLSAATPIHGLVYARHSDWADTAGATVHGAVVAETSLHGSGNTHIAHHPGVLQQLLTQPGTLARVAGSWRDF